MPCLSWYSQACVLTFIVLVVLDSLLQARRAVVNAQLVQLDKEVAEVASQVKDAADRLFSCTDPAKEARLNEIYNNRVAEEQRLDELRSNLRRQLTGALCPLLEWLCACLLAVNRSIKGEGALGHRAA